MRRCEGPQAEGRQRRGRRFSGRLPAVASLLLMLAIHPLRTFAQADTARRNAFGDPFFQISSAIADCPLPAGPFVTEAERRVQAHHRAERGTTCWLSGECDRPNDYAYDADIAAAFLAAMAGGQPFPDTTLWVTVQGRMVVVEGCAASESVVPQIEAFAARLPHVRRAIAIVRTDPAAPPPYKLRSAP